MTELQGGNVRKITTAGIMAALIFVFTWATHIPIPGVSGGYVHVGDSIIYCASYLLGGFYGAAAAGIGSMFADLISGATNYMFGTLVIKALMGFVCAILMTRPKFGRFIVACVVGGAVMAVGYTLYDLVLFGAGVMTADLPFNLIQWAGGVIIAMPLFRVIKSVRGAVPVKE